MGLECQAVIKSEAFVVFEHKINRSRNAILCVMKGKFNADEARQYNARFIEGVDQLEPPITVITDLREYVPADESVRAILQEGTAYAVEKGIKRGVRIVTEDSVTSSIGNIQFNTTARKLGYTVDIAHSMEEATQLLGW